MSGDYADDQAAYSALEAEMATPSDDPLAAEFEIGRAHV